MVGTLCSRRFASGCVRTNVAYRVHKCHLFVYLSFSLYCSSLNALNGNLLNGFIATSYDVILKNSCR